MLLVFILKIIICYVNDCFIVSENNNINIVMHPVTRPLMRICELLVDIIIIMLPDLCEAI